MSASAILRLQAAGFTAEQVKALADLVDLQAASKADLIEVKADLKNELGALKAELGAMKADIGVMKADIGVMKADIGVMKVGLVNVKVDVIRWMIGLSFAQMALLLTILKFFGH